MTNVRLTPYPESMNASTFASASVLLLLALSACKPADQPAAATAPDFATEVKPLLENRCINCHHAGALMGHLNLETRAKAFADRPGGPVIVPGKPGASKLYLQLNLADDNPKAMPPEGHRIPESERDVIKRWIAQGATWPDDASGVLKPLPPVRE